MYSMYTRNESATFPQEHVLHMQVLYVSFFSSSVCTVPYVILLIGHWMVHNETFISHSVVVLTNKGVLLDTVSFCSKYM